MKHIRYFLLLFFISYTMIGLSDSFLRILEPKNNVVVSPQQIHFVWSETFLAGNYQLQLSFDDIFSSIERDTIVAQGSVNITLAEGKTYYWRVRLKATGYNSNWSSTGVFSTLNPKSIGNILLWYDAQDPSLIIGNAVPIWIDGFTKSKQCHPINYKFTTFLLLMEEHFFLIKK
jgi:hypothetical protein